MKRVQLLPLVVATMVTMVAVLASSGCTAARPRFATTWTAPEAHPIDAQSGATVVAVVVQEDEADRQRSERQLATELNRRGDLNAVPSYTLISDPEDEEAAKIAFEQAGAVAVVVMRVVRVDEETSYNPGTYYSRPVYSGYWGGYYGYGWGAAYSPGYLSTETTVVIETLVYDLEQNVLLWAGTSETTNPSNRQEFIGQLVGAASREMRRAGVVAP